MSLVKGSCKDKDIKADIACLFHEYLTVKGLSRPPMFAFVWDPVRRNANLEYYVRRVGTTNLFVVSFCRGKCFAFSVKIDYIDLM